MLAASARAVLLCALLHGSTGESPENIALLQRGAIAVSLDQPVEGKTAPVGKPEPGALQKKAPQKGSQTPEQDAYKENLGIMENAAGDFAAFIINTLMWTVSMVVGILLLSYWRQKYPIMYHGATWGKTPRLEYENPEWEGRFFGWMSAIWNLYETSAFSFASPEAMFPTKALSCGLDQTLGLYYTQLCSRILFTLMIPSVLIFMPLNYFYGGDFAGDDNLSRLGFANVGLNNPLVWFYSFVVWVTVYVINTNILQAQHVFIQHRQAWLKELPFPRSNTILVEKIPEEYRSELKVKKFFNEAMGEGTVDSCYVVKNTSHLQMAKKAVDYYKELLETAKQQLEETGERPTHLNVGPVRNAKGDFVEHQDSRRASLVGYVDSIDTYTTELEKAQAELNEARVPIDAATKVEEPNVDVFWSTALVTFKKRQVAEMALKEIFAEDMDEFMVSRAPAPEAIYYEAFCLDKDVDEGTNMLEFGLLVGIYLGFLPFVVLLCSASKADHLSVAWPWFGKWLQNNEMMLAMWDSTMIPTMLSLLMSFVPWIMEIIMQLVKVEHSDGAHQHELQVWYFYFLVMFVILVTSIGSSLIDALKDIWENPNIVFERLALTMPTATHFYLNYLPLQWCSFAMTMTRYFPLGKFLTARGSGCNDDRSKELAEPEAQDWYGIGSRSSRMCCWMCICIIFCTLCPMITVVGFATFQVTRHVFSYLFVFAETKKEDLGGIFWVTSLKHTQVGIIIYVILMSSVFLCRCDNPAPGVIALCALLPAMHYRGRLDRLQWEFLPNTMCKEATQSGIKSGEYCQPELLK